MKSFCETKIVFGLEREREVREMWGGCLTFNFGEVSYVYGQFLKDYVDSIMREWWLILVNY
jgi:hypothetical protein